MQTESKVNERTLLFKGWKSGMWAFLTHSITELRVQILVNMKIYKTSRYTLISLGISWLISRRKQKNSFQDSLFFFFRVILREGIYLLFIMGLCLYFQMERMPLHIAAERGHTNLVEFLITHCKAPLTDRTNDGSTLIHIASKYGHPETALAFLKRGVPLLMPNKVIILHIFLSYLVPVLIPSHLHFIPSSFFPFFNLLFLIPIFFVLYIFSFSV